MSSVHSEFRQTALWRLAATVSSIVTALLALKLYEKYLGQSLFGLVLTAVNIVGLLPQFDGGYRVAINRRLLVEGPGAARRQLVDFAQALYSWGALAAGILGIGLLLLFSLGPEVRSAGEPSSFYLALGSIGFLAVLGTAQTQLLVGLGRQRQLFILNALSAWVYLGVLWSLFQAGQVRWAFPLAQFSFLGLPTLIAWWLARVDLPGLRLLDFRWTPAHSALFQQLWRDAAPAFVCQLVMLVLYAADSILAVQLLPGSVASDVTQASLLFTMLRRSLQSADEAIWPRLAMGADGAARTSAALVRINAVVYGVVMTVAAVTLPTFIGHWAEGLRPSSLVIWLFAARYLITGLASQPAYYLYGHGRFGDLAKHLGLEFLVAVVLSFLFAPHFAAAGIAGAFALATLVGVAVPLPWAYTEQSKLRPASHFVAVWARALGAMAIAGGISALLMPFALNSFATVAVGAIAVTIALGLFTALAAWRASRHGRVDVRALASHF